eukprot:8590787-Prorocentrum_lima.AAC.1
MTSSLVGSGDVYKRQHLPVLVQADLRKQPWRFRAPGFPGDLCQAPMRPCLLYTSDAADDM